MSKYHWVASECLGIKQALSALNEAEQGGSVDTRIVFLGQAVVEEPSLISSKTPTTKPFFAIFARFPRGAGVQQV